MLIRRSSRLPLTRLRALVTRLLPYRYLARARTATGPAAVPARAILAVTGLLGLVSDVSGRESGGGEGLSGWMFAAAAVGAVGMARVARHSAGLEGVRVPTAPLATGWGSWTRCAGTVPRPGMAAGRQVPALICRGSRPYPFPDLR